MKTHYFAFGSNMSPRQTPRRCPGAQPMGHAQLNGWRLIIGARGGANIIRAPQAVTHGVLWRFEPHHVAQMDEWEGVSVGIYRRQWLRVIYRPETNEERELTALTYIADGHHHGRPRASYINSAMLYGAAAFELPSDYHDEIRGWLPRRPIGANELYRGRRSRKRSG